MSLNAEINFRTIIETFAPDEDIRHALLLTYNFDGEFIEDTERGLLEVIWRRNCENVLVLRDSKAVLTEKQAHRYRVLNAAYSQRTFHPKLMLLLASSQILAVIGSANLTRGGLESNLELVGVYCLGRQSGSVSFFRSLRAYLAKNHLQQELASTSTPHQDAFNRLVRDFDRFLEEVEPTSSSTEPIFFHNYDQPLWPQITQALSGKKVEAVWIVSPFFENSATRPALSNDVAVRQGKTLTSNDDPPDDSLDETTFKTLLTEFNLVGQGNQPPVRIYFQASAANVTILPVQVLQPLKSQIALFKRDAGLDARRLHAKLLVFMGQEGNGKPFVTTIYGSANFTKAALLSTPPHGNAEIVVMTNLPDWVMLAEKLETYLDLKQLFTLVNDWESLTYQPLPSSLSISQILVWEGLVSLSHQTVTIFFQITHPRAWRAVVTLQGKSIELSVGEVTAPFTYTAEFPLPDAAMITVNQEVGLRQLPYQCVRLEVFNAVGQSLGWGEGPLNVDCPELFIGNWQPDQLWHDSLDTQIYLAGLGQTTNYTTWRNYIERVLSPGTKTQIILSHQADLDLFFRRLHYGFRGLRGKLEQSQGSGYVFSDILRRLTRWAKAAVDDPKFTPEQRLYLCQRILQTGQECINILPVNRKPGVLTELEEFLGEAGCLVDFAETMRNDANLGIAAQNLLAQWNSLQFQVKRGD